MGVGKLPWPANTGVAPDATNSRVTSRERSNIFFIGFSSCLIWVALGSLGRKAARKRITFSRFGTGVGMTV